MKHYADYMLLLSPNEHIDSLVQEHKKYATDTIGKYESMYSKAHISVKSVTRQKAFIAEPTLMLLNKNLRTMPPITLTIDGFDYFNHGADYKTIYAKLRSDHITTHWFKTLKKHLGVKDFMVPHITIARNIPIWAFDMLWPHYKTISWIESFTISELTALQRETFDTFATWEVFKNMPFEATTLAQPMPAKRPPLKLAIHSTEPNRQISLF